LALLFVIANLALFGAWGINFKPGLEPDKTVKVKSVKLSPDQAVRAAEINLQLVRGLYANKKNPYQGEITSFIECGKAHQPEEFKVRCAEGETKAIAGGVGERDAFGFCGDTQKLGVFFSCYDGERGELIEVRAFQDFSGQKSMKHGDRLKAIQAWTAKLFP